jgi:hypothetical protein
MDKDRASIESRLVEVFTDLLSVSSGGHGVSRALVLAASKPTGHAGRAA